MTKTGLPKDKDLYSIFWSKEYRAKDRYDTEIARLRADQTEINRLLDAQDRDGVVLVNHDRVKQWAADYEIDMYKLMENKCAEKGRPYIKCVRTASSRVFLRYIGTGPARGLLTPLLLTAEPIKAATKFVSTKGSYTMSSVAVDPDFEENMFITYSDADVRHWVTQRSITILFEGSVGKAALNDWFEFIRSSKLNRMLLGLFK